MLGHQICACPKVPKASCELDIYEGEFPALIAQSAGSLKHNNLLATALPAVLPPFHLVQFWRPRVEVCFGQDVANNTEVSWL
jgi:hypothetical protein